jgi:hypothetical protein
MIKRISILLSGTGLICLLLINCTREEVTLSSLLSEMTHRENLSYFPARHFVLRQFSSYNRASVAKDKDGWYANSDMSHFLRIEKNGGRREFVMFDADGPGTVVRWWMTFYKAQNGTIRIYLDNDTLPLLEGKPSELLRGKMIADPPLAVAVQAGAPLGEEGRDYDHNFYVPLPFSDHCKITYECDSLVLRYEDEGVKVPEGYWWPDVFYNIGYRAYDKGTCVRSVTLAELKSLRQEIDNAGRKLSDETGQKEKVITFERSIPSGDSVVVRINASNNAINRLEALISSDNLPQALRSVVLDASFDGRRTIWVPVGEFFGTGYDTVPHKTWMNEADGKGKFKSFWTMPFRESCTLRFRNYGNTTVTVKGEAVIGKYRWTSFSLYFGSSWHEYNHIRTRTSDGNHFDLNFVDLKGQGIYVGDQIALYNNSWLWWGEGDEKIFVDGESFPSSFGTGSEDYYGYSFGRNAVFSHPFLSQPVGTGNENFGPTVNIRLRSLDAIPFMSGISSNIELWHWADIKMNYALTTFYYIHAPFSTNIAPDPESVRNPVVFSKIDFTLGEK